MPGLEPFYEPGSSRVGRIRSREPAR